MAHLKISRFHNVSTVWLIVSPPALLIFLCGVCSLYPSLHARYLFHELEPLQVGHSTFADAQRLAKKLGAKPDNHSPCDQSYCYWTAVVNNAQLPQWWRGSGVTFAITLNVKDSVLVNKGVWYAIGIIGIDSYTFTPSEVSVGLQEKWSRPMRGYMLPPTQKGWRISYFEKHGHRENISTTFQVHMTPRSSADDWKRYTAFNYGCFWKYKGCKDARELLPAADPLPDDK